MVYLKNLVVGRTLSFLFVSIALMVFITEAESTKIAYKKPILGKPNLTKEKRFKTNPTKVIKTTTTANVQLPFHDELETAESTHALKTSLSAEVKSSKKVEVESFKQTHSNNQLESEAIKESNELNQRIETTTGSTFNFTESKIIVSNDIVEVAKAVVKEDFTSTDFPLVTEETTTATVDEPPKSIEITTKLIETSTTSSKTPVPCTCAVFITSQIKRTGNPYEPPKGKPIFVNELDRTFPCNSIGQKQCQTKCLETIVQHLPNSANILCASLDHDIRKERAYLFIKNCRNQWYNTNLAAGREYCCKNGLPYTCPMV